MLAHLERLKTRLKCVDFYKKLGAICVTARGKGRRNVKWRPDAAAAARREKRCLEKKIKKVAKNQKKNCKM